MSFTLRAASEPVGQFNMRSLYHNTLLVCSFYTNNMKLADVAQIEAIGAGILGSLLCQCYIQISRDELYTFELIILYYSNSSLSFTQPQSTVCVKIFFRSMMING
jgi:hypothetical protein